MYTHARMFVNMYMRVYFGVCICKHVHPNKYYIVQAEMDCKAKAPEFPLPEIDRCSIKAFGMPFGLDFAALKTPKRRNGMAKRFRGPTCRFRAR